MELRGWAGAALLGDSENLKDMAKNPVKEHYQRLRLLTCEELWAGEVREFDAAGPQERMKRVSVVRAVGVVFSESGSPEERERARKWLGALLNDPEEKIRRYAMTALPKLGASGGEESALLGLLDHSASERETKHLGKTLGKIGGQATLDKVRNDDRLARTAQKVQANVARSAEEDGVWMNGRYVGKRLTIHLHCRRGLEQILEEEILDSDRIGERFEVSNVLPGLVAMDSVEGFCLEDVFSLRCFSTMGIVLGIVPAGDEETDLIARTIASPLTRAVAKAFAKGAFRYRLEFPDRGHQRGLVRGITDRVFGLCPEFLNDSRNAPWQIEVRQMGRQSRVELVPRLRPDPRFSYRVHDVPAASHPPLAAAMVRLAGAMRDEVVWDPFCGSGIELIECARRGGVREVYGSDVSAEAVGYAEANWEEAREEKVKAEFLACDFREVVNGALKRGGASIVISNPPMGRRVPVPNLSGLIGDFVSAAADALKLGGRLIFANPLPRALVEPRLRLEGEYRVDLGGFDATILKYVRR